MVRGKLITFEGPEGSGKSTHIRKLADYLMCRGLQVTLTREPGGTALGEKIRNLIQHSLPGEEPVDRAELLLFLASRAQHLHELIRPALAAGRWVLCDRFSDSTMAYQGFGRGFALDELRALNDFAVDHMQPDLTFVLDVSPEISRQRLAARHHLADSAPDRIETEVDAFHLRVREGFLKIAALDKARFMVVNAERHPEVVEQDIRACVTQRFLTPNP